MRPTRPDADSTLIAADRLSLAQLCDVYNLGRADYLVPMPMNQTRLARYLRQYDVDLSHSLVALQAGQALGLALLGRRGARAWITRLGVAAEARKSGLGRRLVSSLVEEAQRLGCAAVILEVIRENVAARQLFEQLGFRATRELLVLRRPPAPIDRPGRLSGLRSLQHAESLIQLAERQDDPSWLTETASLAAAGPLAGLRAAGSDGQDLWLVYQVNAWELSRMVLCADGPEGLPMAQELLTELHWRHPLKDAVLENLPAADPLLPAYQALGYLRAFTRVEMRLDL
ncbi:MAG TPA: GNAT family N-acetyltransferase [Anaerolineae bacterium]|jgi:ribosomal protein S18 acetylase RimI-like enzyme|nr:GNAT family N-acetyltransferase [Ardenticatenia bacterium]HQZ71310.1 GNAT family N-acetyltransferase [Anaerolineae bacterium]